MESDMLCKVLLSLNSQKSFEKRIRNITVFHQADDQSAAQRHENGAPVCPCWIMLLYVSKIHIPKTL